MLFQSFDARFYFGADRRKDKNINCSLLLIEIFLFHNPKVSIAMRTYSDCIYGITVVVNKYFEEMFQLIFNISIMNF